jgi:hypothetical protein
MKFPSCRPSLYPILEIFVERKFVKRRQYDMMQNHRIDENMKMFFVFCGLERKWGFQGFRFIA